MECRYCAVGVPHEECAMVAPSVDVAVHVCHFEGEFAFSDGYIAEDCRCGQRRLSRVSGSGRREVIEPSWLVGQTSISNCILARQESGEFISRLDLMEV